MARAEQSTAKIEEVRTYVEAVAKNLVDKLYGPAERRTITLGGPMGSK